MLSLRRAYGAPPLHLPLLLACFALAGYAALKMSLDAKALRMAVWFLGAVVLHDLVLFPLYSAADRALPRPSVNFVRVPALLSGLLLLLFWPVITQHSEASYGFATGLDQDPYLLRWLLITAALFGASAVLWLVRVRRR